MMMQSETEILIITTHYPYGKIEENWITHELEEFRHHFSKIHLLPVKELEGLRLLPKDVELWEPLATRNRLKFFVWHALMPSTWWYFVDALRECYSQSKITVPRAIICFKFSCYRVAFERNTRLKRFLASAKPKVLYAYWGHIPALAIPMAQNQGAGTCVRFHAVDIYVHRPETGGFYPWRQELREKAGLNAFISEHALAYYCNLSNGRHLGRTSVFRLGTKDFGPPRPRQELTESSPIIMASASWITPIKRVELIAGLATELARRKHVTWHHFGGRNTEEVDYAIEVARKAGVEVVIHGMVAVENLQQFYRECDVTFFANLSRDEGIPVSIMEALNADIPVVATAVGGTVEVVIDGRSGMLVEPNIDQGLGALAARVLTELQPGGLLAAAQPREVWEELYNGHRNASALSLQLVALAR